MPPEETFGDNQQPETTRPETKRPPAKKAKAFIVTERADRTVQVRHSTVVFRRDQVLADPYMIAIAREHHIRIEPLNE